MRKLIAIVMMLLPMLAFLTGCNSLESDAKRQMEDSFKELANDPSSIDVSDAQIVFSTDSCVVIQCTLRTKNAFGALVRSNMEYIYAIDKDCTREAIKNLDKEKSSIKLATEILESNGDYYIKKFKSQEKYLEKMLLVGTTLYGRKLE